MRDGVVEVIVLIDEERFSIDDGFAGEDDIIIIIIIVIGVVGVGVGDGGSSDSRSGGSLGFASSLSLGLGFGRGSVNRSRDNINDGSLGLASSLSLGLGVSDSDGRFRGERSGRQLGDDISSGITNDSGLLLSTRFALLLGCIRILFLLGTCLARRFIAISDKLLHDLGLRGAAIQERLVEGSLVIKSTEELELSAVSGFKSLFGECTSLLETAQHGETKSHELVVLGRKGGLPGSARFLLDGSLRGDSDVGDLDGGHFGLNQTFGLGNLSSKR